MIALNRIRDANVITDKLTGEKLKKALIELLKKWIQFQNGSLSKFKVTSKWGPAKNQLIEESNGKCAFCECEIPSHNHGDVEHFRPKSIYWWMAYTIDNFLLSCSICNQRKSNHFEVRNQRTSCGNLPNETDNDAINQFINRFVLDPSLDNFDDSIIGLKKLKSTENPKLLNPYLEKDIENYFVWSFDDILKEVEILPNEALSTQRKENAIYTIALLDLNRGRLKRKRFKELLKLRKTIELGGSLADIKSIYLESDCEYAGMNQFYCSDIGFS